MGARIALLKHHWPCVNIRCIDTISKTIMQYFYEHHIVVLQGGFGAGKTTICQHIIEAICIPGKCNSPSFSIIKRYPIATTTDHFLAHIDLYRTQSNMLSIEPWIIEEIETASITLIEWGETIIHLLKHVAYIFLDIQYIPDDDTMRTIKLYIIPKQQNII